MRYNARMKPMCKHCQYFRQPGQLDAGIAGEGNWCSNSKSPHFRTRVAKQDGCTAFAARGKKAPLLMRWKVKVLQFVRKVLRTS